MRISELAARSDVPVGTIKYYLREGLLPPGRPTSRTTAEYDDAHVERLRLVRALIDAGGLSIAAVHRILAVLDAPEPRRQDVLATAQLALLEGDPALSGEGDPACSGEGGLACSGEGGLARADEGSSRARDWARARGWSVFPQDPVLARLDRAWQGCEQAGMSVGPELLDDYADAMEQVARVDVASVPAEAEGAVQRVVVGTVMLEPVLSALRMMAQREVTVRQERDSAGPGRLGPAEARG